MNIFPVVILFIGATLALMTEAGPLEPTPPMVARSAILPVLQNGTAPACTARDNTTLPLTRNGMLDRRYRWSQFNVFLDPAFDDSERAAINHVLWDLSQIVPCVRFGVWPRGQAGSGDYLHIIKGTNNGCNSYVGKIGGRQNMNLQSPACSLHYGATMHEMLHALGFHHEHGRPDRDDYVTIHWGNVISGMNYAFDKYSTSTVSTFGVPYNYRSIMHYHGYDFSSNGQPTMTARTGVPVGSYELQETDKRKLKLMYGC